MAGELITYFLAPTERRDFNNGELGMSEPIGPFCVNDARCNEGTMTAEEVLDYVVKMHGEAPVIIEREPWGDEKDDGHVDAGERDALRRCGEGTNHDLDFLRSGLCPAAVCPWNR